ncbi:MAG TPA: coenzyme F420-0:L-glutamate ligase [Candidatus Acidoferrales bacterium]|nr:coenzyme F420-0:L-glutamate ligase [Candidatus Acidoferrales bacterium]
MKQSPTDQIRLIPIRTLPEVRRGTDLAALVVRSAGREGVEFARGDVLVLAQKIVSKAEGRTVRLASVRPSALARQWAPRLGQDPRLTEVVLRESRRVVRMSERVLIVETRHGFVCANAGVDRSNVPGDNATCLPVDPDASARRIAAGLRRRTGISLPVIISDTFGRPWRLGLVNVAIGSWGLRVLEDLRGTRDALGHPLRATILAVADELAAAAGLLMAKNAATPAVIVRGYRYRPGPDTAQSLLRPAAEDLFR